MSYESAAIATQEMKSLSRFRRPVGAIAVLALAAGLSGCGAQEQRNASSETSVSSSRQSDPSYSDLARAIGNGPVEVATGFLTEELDPNIGKVYAVSLAAVNGDPTCEDIGKVQRVPRKNVRLYTATHNPHHIEEVPRKAMRYQTTLDGNATADLDKTDTIRIQCVKFEGGKDDFDPATQIPSQAVFNRDGNDRKTIVVTKMDGGLNAALRKNGELNK